MAQEKGQFGVPKGEAPNVQTKTRRGKVKRMYEEMVEQYQMQEAMGKSPAEYMFNWMRNEDIPIDIRARAAFKLEETKLKMVANEGIGAQEEQAIDIRSVERDLQAIVDRMKGGKSDEKLAAESMEDEDEEE